MERQIDCPNCKSKNTSPVPETAWMRSCSDCDAEWDIRTPDEIAQEDW